MLRYQSVVVAAIASFALAAPAQALVVIANFSGQILTGTDTSGFFTGIAGQDLTTADGSPTLITGRVSYDPDLAPANGLGGYGGDGVTDWLGFEVTIAGTTYQFGGFAPTVENLQLGLVSDGPDEILDLQLQREGVPGSETVGLKLGEGDFLTGTDLPTSFTYTNPSGGVGSFTIATADVTADATFSITAASTAAIPEPLVWMNLIVGFGLIGGVLRRRPRLGTATA